MRSARPLALVLPALVLLACEPPDEVHLNDGPLHQAFEDASLETGVPKDLLLAVGWYESRWVHVVPEARQLDEEGHGTHGNEGFGVMQLSTREEHDTLGLAAALSELDAEVLKADAASNVRGAALVLRRFADEMYEGVEVETLDLFAWRDVVARWSGLEDPADAYDAAHAVFEILREGAGRTLDDGEALELLPNPGLGEEEPALEGDVATEESELGVAGVPFDPASPSNYTVGRGGNKVKYVVIHTMQGSFAGSRSWFKNPRANVSAHYNLRSSDGAAVQMVDENNTAWHAGNWSYNQQSIGIEHEGFVADAAWYTEVMYRASARITCDIVRRHGIPVTRDRILGHVEVPHATNTDPGRHWNWDHYMSLVRQCAGGGGGGGQDNGSPGGGGGGGGGGGSVRPGEGTIQGIVYADGNVNRRIPGAVVRLSNGRTVTAASNGYWSAKVPAGRYGVTATAGGFDPGSVNRTVTAGTQMWASISLRRAAQPVQTGRVTGVVFEAPDANRRLTATISVGDRRVTTDANGRYTLELPVGQRELGISSNGFLSKTLYVQVRAGQTATVNAGLHRRAQLGDLVGVVYELPSANKRLAGATVTARGEGRVVSATADGAGYFEFKGVPVGTWTVNASAAGYGSGSKRVGVRANTKVWGSVGLSKLRAGAGDGTLVGVVYESPDTRRRLPGATVRLSTGVSVTADRNGVYRVPARGTVTIVASAAGFAPRSATRTVPAGRTIWGSIGLVRGRAPTSAGSTDLKCQPNGANHSGAQPAIRLVSPVDNAVVGREPEFEYSAVGAGATHYVAELIPPDRGDVLRIQVGGGEEAMFILSTPLAPGGWSWGLYPVWADCSRGEIASYGFFTVR